MWLDNLAAEWWPSARTLKLLGHKWAVGQFGGARLRTSRLAGTLAPPKFETELLPINELHFNAVLQDSISKIMSAKNKTPEVGRFIWNELVAKNETTAKRFYSRLFGWKTKPFGQGIDYTLFRQDQNGVGGMYQGPQAGAPAYWLPYVVVKDVDATVKKAKKLGAIHCAQPCDIPTVGRIAVLTDPQGASIGIIAPKM
jgi:predicted enzyme related to lactoylglutathione lyase